jgi:hypothetical protein
LHVSLGNLLFAEIIRRTLSLFKRFPADAALLACPDDFGGEAGSAKSCGPKVGFFSGAWWSRAFYPAGGGFSRPPTTWVIYPFDFGNFHASL